MNLLREIYAQGVDAIVRLVHRLADCVQELEAQSTHAPQLVIASLS